MSAVGQAENVALIITFKLKDGVTDGQWADAVAQAAAGPGPSWTEQQPGYISGQTYYDADAETWIDVELWESRELAALHLEKAPKAEENAAMFALIDEQSVQVRFGAPAIAAR